MHGYNGIGLNQTISEKNVSSTCMVAMVSNGAL